MSGPRSLPRPPSAASQKYYDQTHFDPEKEISEEQNAEKAGRLAQQAKLKADRLSAVTALHRQAVAAGHDPSSLPKVDRFSSDPDVIAATGRLNRLLGVGQNGPTVRPGVPFRSGSAIDRAPFDLSDASGLSPLPGVEDPTGRTVAASGPASVPAIDQPPTGTLGSFKTVVPADPNGGPNAIRQDRTVQYQPSAHEALAATIPGYDKMTNPEKAAATLKRYGGTSRGEAVAPPEVTGAGYTNPNLGGPVQSGAKFVSPYGTASVTNGPAIDNPATAVAGATPPTTPESDAMRNAESDSASQPLAPSPAPVAPSAQVASAPSTMPKPSGAAPSAVAAGTGIGNAVAAAVSPKPNPDFQVNFDTNAPKTIANLKGAWTQGNADLDKAKSDIVGTAGGLFNPPKLPAQQAAAIAPKPPSSDSTADTMDDREKPENDNPTPPLPQIGPKTSATDDQETENKINGIAANGYAPQVKQNSVLDDPESMYA